MVGKNFAGTCLTVVAVVALSGCGADGHGSLATPSASAWTAPVRTAPWAEEVVTGEQLWQASAEGLTLTAYDMGEDTAAFDSGYSDDVTAQAARCAAGEPVPEAGCDGGRPHLGGPVAGP